MKMLHFNTQARRNVLNNSDKKIKKFDKVKSVGHKNF